MTLQEFRKALIDYGNECIPEKIRSLILIPDTSGRPKSICLFIANKPEDKVIELIKSLKQYRKDKLLETAGAQLANGLLSFREDLTFIHKDISEVFPDKNELDFFGEEKLRLKNNIEKAINNKNKTVFKLIKAAGLEAFIKKSDNSSHSKPQSFKNKKSTMKKFPLNQILYGPPGTGKTYHTINKALEIIGEDLEGKSRAEIKKLFDAKMNEGQIVFTTFHQSLGYEDFIEGIKPIEPAIEGGSVIYKVKDGIFKQLCNRITSSERMAGNQENNGSITSFNDLHSKFIEKLKAIVNGLEENEHHIFPSRRSGVILVKIDGENIITTGESANSTENVTKEKLERIYKKFDSPEAITNIVRQLREVGTDIGWTTNYYAVFKALKEFEESLTQNIPDSKKKPKNYVLIIDEINRGNVSQIFGELITVLEDDKRLGKTESLEVKLPYSKESFGVPPNLYLIGTMNTADRSVEALDTALRRRFDFVQMLPKPYLLAPGHMFWKLLWDFADVKWSDSEYKSKERQLFDLFGGSDTLWNQRVELWNKFEKEGKSENQIKNFPDEAFSKLNLKSVLQKINQRIEKLIDKDHCIGHSYFVNLFENEDAEEALRNVFQNKILPLLQEYFFGDLGKIELVIGEAFFEPQVSIRPSDFFAKNAYEDIELLAERKVYEIKNVKNPEFDIIATVRKIYQNEEDN